MNTGKVVIEDYCIEPKTRMNILREDDFNIFDIKKDKVFVSKKPFECHGVLFWVTIFTKDFLISKVELTNADEKYKMNYSSMTSDLLDEVKEENEMFLQKECGDPDEVTLSGVKYNYSWGMVSSYFDNKTPGAGIVINYW